MASLLNYRYSIIAGTYAASGSFFGKLPSFLLGDEPDAEFSFAYILKYMFPLLLMLICNALNWRYFLKALHSVDHTLTATVLTAAANYMISFLLAYLFFHEGFTMLSSLGALLNIIGLWLLCGTQEDKQALKKKS